MSFWDHLFERHSDKLTFTQRTIRHGIVFAFAFALGACLKMLIDALLGNDVDPEQALQFAGIGVAASVVITAIDLLRGPQPTTKPELYGLTWLGVVVAVVVCSWLADVLFGWDADLESTLGIAVGMLVGAAIITVVRLDRAPQPSPEPDLHLTDEMSRRVR